VGKNIEELMRRGQEHISDKFSGRLKLCEKNRENRDFLKELVRYIQLYLLRAGSVKDMSKLRPSPLVSTLGFNG
jgi:hypothetical protein